MSKHLQKIEKIFSHPLPANIDVKKTLSALEHFGVRVEVTKGHSAKLFFNDKEGILRLPHGDHFTKDEVVQLRHILEDFGLTPDNLKK
ncbi:hypothetical protein [Hydrogenimonas sp.]